MKKYDMGDVITMLRGSKKLNQMQTDIRQFVALVATNFQWRLDTTDVTEGHMADFTDNPHGVVAQFHLCGHPLNPDIDVWYGSLHHKLWNGKKYSDPPHVLVGPIWNNLPVLLNTLAERIPAVNDHIKFLQKTAG